MGSKLTPKQEAFCQEYMKDGNGTRAYIAAGYKAKSNGVARNGGAENLAKPCIASRIEELKAEAAKEEEITFEKIVKAYAKLAFLAIDPADAKPADILKALEQLSRLLGFGSDFNTAIGTLRKYGIELIQTEAGWQVAGSTYSTPDSYESKALSEVDRN